MNTLFAPDELDHDDRLQRLLAGPRLRQFMEWGEQIDSLESSFAHMQDAIRKLKSERRQKKTKGHSRKA